MTLNHGLYQIHLSIWNDLMAHKTLVVSSVRADCAPGLSANQKIDICRGLFAILVVSAHAVDISLSIHPDAVGRNPWWYFNLMHHVAGNGIFWVMGFFVISGYCIQLSVSRTIEADSFHLSHYVAARLTRILPLYYLGLVTVVVVEWLIASNRGTYWSGGINGHVFLSQLFLLQRMGETYGSYGPSWSISNEMLYYMMYGILICFTRKSRTGATILGMIVCAAVGLSMELVHFGWNRPPHVLSIGLLFGLGTIWFLGAWIADNRQRIARSRLAGTVSACWPIVLLVSIVIWFLQWIHIQFVYMTCAVAFGLMMVRFVTHDCAAVRATRGGWRAAVIEILGQSSYPTYLFHGPLGMLVASFIPRSGILGDWRITWLILVLVGGVSGLALGFLIERPILIWRKTFLRQFESKRTATAPSGAIVGIAELRH